VEFGPERTGRRRGGGPAAGEVRLPLGSPRTQVANVLNGLTFVKDDEDYICWNNCNHVVLRWLEELGCTTSGRGCFADFRIVGPGE